jgi:hypothetical protein
LLALLGNERLRRPDLLRSFDLLEFDRGFPSSLLHVAVNRLRTSYDEQQSHRKAKIWTATWPGRWVRFDAAVVIKLIDD